MSDKNSGGSGTFGFVKPNTDETKQNPTTGIENTNEDNKVNTEQVAKVTVQQEIDKDANAPYVDRRSITISLVKNYSKYREANRTALPRRVDYIGSSVSSSRILSSNEQEVNAYFPRIIGLSPNNENFISAVKKYLNNIQIVVDELGRTFDISFHYKHKKDYDKVVAIEEAIEKKYKSANRQNLNDLREALKEKITTINDLESTKYALGSPVNIEDYLMYRHCMLYNDIAKDTALINSDISIRFYFKDDQKEAKQLRALRTAINTAKANYVTALSDEHLFNAIYIQYCVSNNLPVISSLAESKIDREIKLDRYSQDEPVKFNKLFNNKDIKLMSSIEHLIARGILIRSMYNQNITDTDGTPIGANMVEAIGWFKNPENKEAVDVYNNTLNNI